MIDDVNILLVLLSKYMTLPMPSCRTFIHQIRAHLTGLSATCTLPRRDSFNKSWHQIFFFWVTLLESSDMALSVIACG
jgi:hypothetical protein